MAKDKVWMRMGDNADYEPHDSMFDAGSELGGYLGGYFDSTGGLTKMPVVSKRGNYGLSVDPFTGYNYISLFWGDDDAQPVKKLTQADIADFKAGIRDGAYLFLKPKAKKPSTKRKSSKRSSSTPTSIRGMR